MTLHKSGTNILALRNTLSLTLAPFSTKCCGWQGGVHNTQYKRLRKYINHEAACIVKVGVFMNIKVWGLNQYNFVVAVQLVCITAAVEYRRKPTKKESINNAFIKELCYDAGKGQILKCHTNYA